MKKKYVVKIILYIIDRLSNFCFICVVCMVMGVYDCCYWFFGDVLEGGYDC